MTNKIYFVTAAKSPGNPLENTFKLDADIQHLAVSTKADVHMHRFKGPVGGNMGVLVECPESFVEEIRKLPLFNDLRALTSTTSNIRRSAAPQIEAPEAMSKPPRGPRR